MPILENKINFDMQDNELKSRMLKRAHADDTYKACLDILLLRRHESLIDKTQEIVRKTWWVAFGTWVMAFGTLVMAGATIISILFR